MTQRGDALVARLATMEFGPPGRWDVVVQDDTVHLAFGDGQAVVKMPSAEARLLCRSVLRIVEGRRKGWWE